MELPVGMMINGLDTFILVFIRMTGLFVIAPIFGRRNIPNYFKIGFSLMLALIIINTLPPVQLSYYDNIYAYTLLVFKEFIVGITLGYVSYLVFTAIYMAGQIIDMQIGFGMVSVLDPVSNIQVPVTSNFYFIICMMIFLDFNGHHALIRSLFESYNILPIGTAAFNPELMNDIIRAFGNIFIIGFKISAPIVATILITDVALGVISKSVPQLNFFVVGIPIKIVLGLAVLILTLKMFGSVVDVLINGMNSEMLNFIKDMAPK
ncbi:MAG: flagellar biosynthetic protein FliR [Clostridia bacterium]|nr:flagellar biosynthetic protein FliR [Clostridia bacterium]